MSHEQVQGVLYLMLFLGASIIGMLTVCAITLNQILSTLRKR